jgi:hypothetical protein
MNEPILHIWQQSCHHDEAFIFGNKEALTLLRDSINLVLGNGNADSSAEFFQKDGEGYRVVIRTASDFAMLLLPTAYTDYGNASDDYERNAFAAVISGSAE